MKTKVQELSEKLADLQVAGFNVFPGTGNPTQEEVADEVLKSLKRLEEGDFEVVANIGF